jgi:exodeoxyribonuclease VII large subunit
MQNTRDILSVTRLNEAVRDLLEQRFLAVWVEGEISNLAQPGSGHLYFTLKDEGAQIRAAMFRGQARLLRFTPKQGQKVLVRARLSLYVPRGDYQLIVEHMEEAGLGALQRAFEQLRQKLLLEGLFEAERKRELPAFPKHLAVITSPTGAAIRDILSVLRRRFPGLPVTIIPVPVQGTESAPAIVRAITLANSRPEFDVLLLSRGGGSLEDLWAFNEEIVARAIAGSRLPVITGVGHEVDFTIADFVADVRAPTPSAAAELLSPNSDELLEAFRGYGVLLENAMRRRLQGQRQQLTHLLARLRHPGRRIEDLQQKLDGLEQRLHRAWEQFLHRRQTQVAHLYRQMQAHSPGQRLREYRLRLQHLQQRQQELVQQRLLRDRHKLDEARLHRAMDQLLQGWQTRLRELQSRLQAQNPAARLREYQLRLGHLQERQHQLIHQRLERSRQRLELLAQRANSVSPLATLARGYAIIEHDGHIVRAAQELRPGDSLRARLGQGFIEASVVAVEE